MPSVTRVHSSDAQVFINDFRLKGVQSFNYENPKSTTEIRKLGSYKTEDYVLNSDQPVTASMNFLLTSRKNLEDTLTSNIDNAIDGKTASATTMDVYQADVFNNADATQEDLERNTNCWIHNLTGITSIVAWNSRNIGDPEGTNLGGIAISKRHILHTRHAAYNVNDIVYFVTKNDTLISRTIVARNNNTSSLAAATDFGVCLLDEDLPDSIEVVKVLPRDAYQYFDASNISSPNWFGDSGADQTLCFFVDADHKANIRRLSALQFRDLNYRNPTTNLYGLFAATPPSSDYDDWTEDMVNGDSGSPFCLIINNECVLIGLTYGGYVTTSGPFVSSAKTFKEINELIRDVDKEYGIRTGYQLSTIDLSQEFRPQQSTQYKDFLSHEETTIALKDNAGTTTFSKAYLTDYSIQFAVGDFTQGSYSYEADSISTSSSSETETISDTFNIFKPQNITVTTDFNEGINSTEYAIQNITLNVSIERQATTRIGSRGAKRRYPTLPSNGSLTFSIIKNNTSDTVDLSNLVTEKGNFTFSVEGSDSTLNIEVDNCFLESVGNSQDLDGNATLDFNYTFPISNDAIKYYFS